MDAMELQTETISVRSKGHTDIIDLTSGIQELVSSSRFTEGSATIFAVGSTAGITTIEYEPGLVDTDMSHMFDKIAPYGKPYAHNETWGCDNGAAHLRASLLGSSLIIPFAGSKLLIGTWQQIVVIDFDTRPRSRKVVVQLQGIRG